MAKERCFGWFRVGTVVAILLCMNTTTTTQNDTNSALESVAKSDMACARRNGYLLMGSMKYGTMTLSYSDRTYTLVDCGSRPEQLPVTLIAGKAAAVKNILKNYYVVEAA